MDEILTCCWRSITIWMLVLRGSGTSTVLWRFYMIWFIRLMQNSRMSAYSPDLPLSWCVIWAWGVSIPKSKDSESLEELSEDSVSPEQSSSSSSMSLLEGRLNTSSSDSGGGSTLTRWTFRKCLEGFSASWKSGHIGTQTRGSRSWTCLSLQWSSRRNTSPIWILDGSFHSNPCGIHSLLIQEDGSFTNVPHGMICFFFPVTKPNSNVLYFVGQWITGQLTDMCSAILPEHWLYNLGLIAIGHGGCWKLGTSAGINGDGDLSIDCLWVVLLLRDISSVWKNHKNVIDLDEKLANPLKNTAFQIQPILPKGQRSSNLGRTWRSLCHRPPHCWHHSCKMNGIKFHGIHNQMAKYLQANLEFLVFTLMSCENKGANTTCLMQLPLKVLNHPLPHGWCHSVQRGDEKRNER